MIGSREESATVHKTSQLGNTRKGKESNGRHGEGRGEKKFRG
jgi:hypothetical protein